MFKVHQIKVQTFRIPKCVQHFWDPKSVHFYMMYLKHGSIIGLMVTLSRNMSPNL